MHVRFELDPQSSTPMDQPISKTQHPASPELTVVSAASAASTAAVVVDEDKFLKVGNRKVVTDHFFDAGVTDEATKYAQTVFVRLNARKKLRFEKVSFKQCVFDGCYIVPDRKVVFSEFPTVLKSA